MKKITYILILAALALGFASCEKEKIKEEPVYSSVLTPDFSFDETIEYVAGENATVSFVNKSKAEGTEITGYFWHFGFMGYDSNSELETPDPVTYEKSGEYIVKLTVYGKDGNRATAQKTVTVLPKNSPPTVSFSVNPQDPSVNSEVTFTSTSVDADGTLASFEWTVDGAKVGTEAVLKHTFTAGGFHTVSLKATDDRGDSGEATSTLFVFGAGSGSGTENDPWLIRTADQWFEIVASVNGGSGTYGAGDYYVVCADLDFSGKTMPMMEKFEGVLDGRNFAFKNMSATWSDGVKYKGIIRENTGTIRNLVLDNMNLSAETCSTVGFVGVSRVGSVIDNVIFKSGSVLGADRSGGLCGELDEGVIVNCGVQGGTVQIVGNNVGGMVGYVHGFVVNCYSWAERVTSTTKGNVGGLTGDCGEEKLGAAINCYSTCEKFEQLGNYSAKRKACVIGRSYWTSLQNIYGAFELVVGTHKPQAPSFFEGYWGTVVKLDNMKTGAVTVPSSGKTCASFVDALNEGVAIYNAWEHESKPQGISLRAWVVSPETELPVIAQ